MDLFEEIMEQTVDKPTVDSVTQAAIIETTNVVVKDNISKETTELKSEQRIVDRIPVSKKTVYLNVKFSTNINLGDYQSAKVEKGLMIPLGTELDPTVTDKIKATDLWASKLIEELIQKEITPIREAIKRKQAGGR